MTIHAKLLAEIHLEDIDALIAAGSAETQLLEFKEALPFKPTKGQPETADRWNKQGDRIGEYARDEILAEMVAFANADGGTLILGLAESDDTPARAREIKPLRLCVELAARLLSAAEDVIEPRLASLTAESIVTDDEGNGVVLLRCGRSIAGPHRLKTTREFYIRRGERAARMTAREIRDMSLQLARSGDRYAQLSSALQLESKERFTRLERATPGDQAKWNRLCLRAAAVPATQMELHDLTRRREYFWRPSRFPVTASGQAVKMGGLADEFAGNIDIRLRALQMRMQEDGVVFRKVSADGTAVFEVLRDARAARAAGTLQPIYLVWCITLLAGAIAQAEWTKRLSGNDSVTFGIEFEILSDSPVALVMTEDGINSGRPPPPGSRVSPFPAYELAPGSDLDELVNTFARDLCNAWGANPPYRFEIDWQAFLPSLTTP